MLLNHNVCDVELGLLRLFIGLFIGLNHFSRPGGFNCLHPFFFKHIHRVKICERSHLHLRVIGFAHSNDGSGLIPIHLSHCGVGI